MTNTPWQAYRKGDTTPLRRGDAFGSEGQFIFSHVRDDGQQVITVGGVELDAGSHGLTVRRPAGTIDLTPTWRGILRYLLVGLTDGNATGQKIAAEELERMADLADAYNARVAAPLDWRPVSEYVNVRPEPGGHIDDQPSVMLFHGKTGFVTICKVIKFPDGEVRAMANGYHGYEWTMFATFNTPAK